MRLRLFRDFEATRCFSDLLYDSLVDSCANCQSRRGKAGSANRRLMITTQIQSWLGQSSPDNYNANTYKVLVQHKLLVMKRTILTTNM